jgi:hypothetical protein
VVPIAAKAATSAAIARIESSPLGAAAAGAAAVLCGALPVGRCATGAAAARGAGAAATGAAWAAGAGGFAGAGARPEAPVGPPGGSVGNLIVGAAEGFGGKLIRTVSFLGWTLPVSFLGGTAPAGILGMLSAIACFKISLAPPLSNLIRKENRAEEATSTRRKNEPLAAFATLLVVAATRTATPALLRALAFFTRPRNVHRQRTALKFFVVELFDGFVRFILICEFDECEATGFAGHLVQHEVHRCDDASLGKIILKIVFHGLVREVAHKEPGRVHNTSVCSKTAWEDCTGRITECRLGFTDNLSSDTNTVGF